jgi:hypothetical protein
VIGFDGGGSKLILRSRIFLFEWKVFMVRKDRRNNFFLFEKEDKTQGYTGELGLEMI